MGAASSVHVLCCPIQRVNCDQAGALGGGSASTEEGLNGIPVFLWLFSAQLRT